MVLIKIYIFTYFTHNMGSYLLWFPVTVTTTRHCQNPLFCVDYYYCSYKAEHCHVRGVRGGGL